MSLFGLNGTVFPTFWAWCWCGHGIAKTSHIPKNVDFHEVFTESINDSKPQKWLQHIGPKSVRSGIIVQLWKWKLLEKHHIQILLFTLPFRSFSFRALSFPGSTWFQGTFAGPAGTPHKWRDSASTWPSKSIATCAWPSVWPIGPMAVGQNPPWWRPE